MLISPLNLSEGNRLDVVGEVCGAAARFCGVLDVHSDPDHNRSVVTLAGEPGPLLNAVVAAAGRAVALIDLRLHKGAHPRMGAVDVAPFVPVSQAEDAEPESAYAQAISTSLACAERLWRELQVPCFFYELSAPYTDDGPVSLPSIRRRAFAGKPADVGSNSPHPSAGATVVGARDPLVAYNINLDTDDLSAAKQVAAALRTDEALGALVRAMGFSLASRGIVQVSCNLLSPEVVTIPNVFDAVARLAGERDVEILESEVVGLAPVGALGRAKPQTLRMTRAPGSLEDCLAAKSFS